MKSYSTLVLGGNDDRKVVGRSGTSGERSGFPNRNGSLLTERKYDIRGDNTNATGSSRARRTVDGGNTNTPETSDHVVNKPSRIPVPGRQLGRITDVATVAATTMYVSRGTGRDVVTK